MEITTADPLDAVAVPFGAVTAYRVRGWLNRGEADAPSWAVDEWDVVNAESVEDVLAWARGRGFDTFEVFVQWDDHAQSATGGAVVQRRFSRVHGLPGDAGGVPETVVFVKRE